MEINMIIFLSIGALIVFLLFYIIYSILSYLDMSRSMEQDAVKFVEKELDTYASNNKVPIINTPYMYKGKLGVFECQVFTSTKKIVENSAFIALSDKLPDLDRVIVKAHECGHHYYINKENDRSEESAWKWTDSFLGSCPLWVQSAMVYTRKRQHDLPTPYIGKYINTFEAVQAYKDFKRRNRL